MFNSLKEAAAKQAAKLKEAIDEASAASQSTPIEAQSVKSSGGDVAAELQYLKLENEALKSRLREVASPPSDREAELERKLQAKTAEHENLAEKSRELMIRYRKLQSEKNVVGSPEAKNSSVAVTELESKLAFANSELEKAKIELEQLKNQVSARADDVNGGQSIGDDQLRLAELKRLHESEISALKNEAQLVTEKLQQTLHALEEQQRESLADKESLRALNVENESLNNQINELSIEHEDYKKKVSLVQSLQQDLERANHELLKMKQREEDAQTHSSHAVQERDEVAQKLTLALSEAEELKSKMVHQEIIEAELTDTKRHLAQAIEKLAAKESSDGKMSTASGEIGELRMDEELKLRSLSSELDAAKAELKSKQLQVDSLAEKVSEMTQRESDQSLLIKGTNERLEAIQRENALAVQRASDAENNLKELKAAIATQGDDSETEKALRSSLAELGEDRDRLLKENAEIMTARDRREAELQMALDQAQQDAVSALQEKNGLLKAAQEEAVKLRQSESTLRTDLEHKEKDLESLEARDREVTELKLALSASQSVESELRQKLQASSSKEARFSSEIQSLQESLDEVRRDAASLQDEKDKNAQVQLQLAALLDENRALAQALKDNELALHEREMTRNSIEKEWSAKEVELRVTIDRMERQLREAERRAGDLQQELRELPKASETIRTAVVMDDIDKEIDLRVALDRELRMNARLQQIIEGDENRSEQLDEAMATIKALREELATAKQVQSQAGIDVSERLNVALARIKELEAEQQNRAHDLDRIREESMQGRLELLQKLQEKEVALAAADETMKRLADAFDNRSSNEAQLRRDLEAERLKVEETEMKMRAEFDRVKLEVQLIYEEKAKVIQTKMEEALQEAEAAHAACSGFQRQLKEAQEDAMIKSRELDSLKERTRDALVKLNEEKKELQEKISSLQTALEKKTSEALPTEPTLAAPIEAPSVPSIEAEEAEKLRQEKIEVEEALAASRELASTLKNDIDALRIELEAAQSILKSTESTEQRLNYENNRLKDELTVLKQDLKQRKERAEKLLGEKESQIDKLNERLASLQDPEKLNEVLEQSALLQKENRDLTLKLEGMRDEIDHAQQEAAMFRRKITEYQHHQGQHSPSFTTPARHPDEPSSVYLRNVLLAYMSSRDPREQLGMVKAISQLAGFSSADQEKIRRSLEEANQGMFGKLVGSVLSLNSAENTPAPSPPTPSNPRVMKRVG